MPCARGFPAVPWFSPSVPFPQNRPWRLRRLAGASRAVSVDQRAVPVNASPREYTRRARRVSSPGFASEACEAAQRKGHSLASQAGRQWETAPVHE